MNENTPITTSDVSMWWLKRRVRYNLGLLIAGFIAFVLLEATYLVRSLLSHTRSLRRLSSKLFFRRESIFFMMGLANLFYTSGSVVDLCFNKNNSHAFS